jgi:hypothetical protein
MSDEARITFLQQIAAALGQEPAIEAWGASQRLRLVDAGRSTDVCTNGAMFWIDCDVSWPEYRRDVILAHAPLESYLRAKLPEEGEEPAQSGDRAFDDAFVILGPGAQELVSAIGPALRRTFVEFADVHPILRTQQLVSGGLIERVHIHAEPRLYEEPYQAGGVALGTQRFTSAHCAVHVRRTILLAKAIETHSGG